MKEWVADHLKTTGQFNELTSETWHEIEDADFNCLEREGYKDLFFKISEILMKDLCCNFGKSPNQKAFSICFGSVLADLPKERFHELCEKKDVFYIYNGRSDKPPAYIKTFSDIDISKIHDSKQIKIATFTYEVEKENWLSRRHIIIHELMHIFFPEEDDDGINKKIREWGFIAESDEANKKVEGKHNSLVESLRVPIL